MPDVNYVSLSKAMSKALRHQPERLGITLAADGSVAVEELIDALNRRGGWPRTLDEHDIMQVVEHGTKQRFAVEDGRIRARYGHSLPVAVSYERAEPPAVLYHGTSPASLEHILAEGLLPMGRQVVHLSTDVPTAVQELFCKRQMTPDFTARELEVLKFLPTGMTNDAIAERLGVGKDAIKNHLRNIFVKLDVGDRVSAVREAVTRGFLK